jgi:hypothetical protein
LVARPLAQALEELQGLVGRRAADEGGDPRLGLREQLQDGRRDDAERSLGADEQVPQVIAGIVLA